MPTHPFSQIADIAPVMLWMTNADGVCIYLSRSWYEFTGQTPQTGLDFGWLDAVHSDDFERTQKAFLEANEQHISFQFEYRLRTAGGDYRWAMDTGQPHFEEDGEFVGYVGSVIDINDSKRATEALLQNETRYRHLFAEIDEGFVICEMIFDENRKPIDYRFLEANESFGIMTGLPMPYALGRRALELVPNLEHFWIETYGNVVLTGEANRFEQHSPSMHRSFDAYAFSVGNDQFAILFKDVTQERRIKVRAHLLQTLAAGLSAAQTLNEVIATIMGQGVKKLDAPKGVLALLGDDGKTLDIISLFGYPEWVADKWRSIPLDHPTAPFALAVREHRALWLESLEARREVISDMPDLSAEEQHQAWAVLPFTVGKSLIGVLGLGYDEPTQFDEAEQTFLLTLADYSAQALERARLSEQTREIAAMGERARLARDLHDAVSQLLFASTTITESLSRTWARDPEKGKSNAEQVLILNRAAMAEMRKLLMELRPEAIVRTPFYDLLEQLVRALQGMKDIEVILTFNAAIDLILPPDVHVALYRIMQEALNNVSKHSRAAQLEIVFDYDETLRLTVSDNGVGFDPERTSKGMGMHSMRERAQAVGVALQIRGEPDKGTRLTMHWQPDSDAR